MDIELDPFLRAAQKADEWTNEVKQELGAGDLQIAWRALGAVLHALRDRLTIVEVTQLGAQLPLLVRGLYYESAAPTTATRAVARDPWAVERGGAP